MTRVRGLIILLLALTAGGLFACGTYRYVQKQPVQAAAMPTRPVVVAAADLDVGGTITRDDIKVVEWPTNAVPANVMSDPNDAEKLTLAATDGKIQLALRNPLDKDAPATRGVRPAVLVGMAAPPQRVVTRVVAGKPAPPPPPSADPTVEIIRGDKRAREVVRQEP